jgi:hypothetical protein
MQKDRYYTKLQQKKMKELWDNKEYKAWVNAQDRKNSSN